MSSDKLENAPSYFNITNEQVRSDHLPNSNYAITNQPPIAANGVFLQPTALAYVSNEVAGAFDVLANQKSLFIRQSFNSGVNSMGLEEFHILNENQEQLYRVCIQRRTYHHGMKSRYTTQSCTINDMSGRIVLQFEEDPTGTQITSGGYSLGVIQAASCLASELVATMSVGGHVFKVSGPSSISPFGINYLSITSNASSNGSIERIPNSMAKLTFPSGIGVREKTVVMVLGVITFIGYFATGCGCSSGRRGIFAFILLGFCAFTVLMFLLIIIIPIIVFTTMVPKY